MKKIIIISLLILSIGMMSFANEISHSAKNNISFRMPDMTVRLSDEYDDDIRIYREFDPQHIKSASVANRAVGAVILGLSAIPNTTFMIMCAITMMSYAMYISPVFTYGVQMTLSGAMMIYLGVRQAHLMKQNVSEAIYKYEICKVMRNIGIITLSTSIIPLATVIPYIIFPAGMTTIIYASANGLACISQLILGITLLVFGLNKMLEWEEIAFPEVSVVHDDRKGYNEGYAVNVGLRIKI